MLDFTGNISAPTASVTTKKCVFNSVVSTPGARCMLANIKVFYSNNILPDPEFMCFPLRIIPLEIMNEYNLATLVENKGGYTCSSKRACMDSDNPVSLLTSNWWNIWLNLGIIPYNTHLACRYMINETPPLALWLMIFVFSITPRRMPNILKIHSKKNISLQLICKWQSILELIWIGTMWTE